MLWVSCRAAIVGSNRITFDLNRVLFRPACKCAAVPLSVTPFFGEFLSKFLKNLNGPNLLRVYYQVKDSEVWINGGSSAVIRLILNTETTYH